MEDTDGEEKRRDPDGTTLTVEEWIELMDKHHRLDQYATELREKSDDE